MKLANACSQNCGSKIHRELASRSFTDALLRLAGDRVSCQPTNRWGYVLICVQNTHQQVKAKILERMAEWSEEFSKDPDLGIMDQAYMKLKAQSMPDHHVQETKANP